MQCYRFTFEVKKTKKKKVFLDFIDTKVPNMDTKKVKLG